MNEIFSWGVSLFVTISSPIFLEYRQIGYFFSFFGVVIGLPILYPFEPALILPIATSFFLATFLSFFSVTFRFAVFSFLET